MFVTYTFKMNTNYEIELRLSFLVEFEIYLFIS